MGNPATEQDLAPPSNTLRRFVWQTVAGIKWARAFFGRRLLGGAIGLFGDALGEGVSQAIYARLPGHQQQAPDSLVQSAMDAELFRFRGETDANWLMRVSERWDDYEQGGTDIQMLKVLNQWGNAGWPVTWVNLVSADLVESGSATDFSFTITIAFGLIHPSPGVWTFGSGHAFGEVGLYFGVASTDLATMLYLVRKWKPSRSKAYVKVYYTVSDFVTFVVGV